MSASTVVILAAGRGTRMRSATPKLAHELCGRPLLAWPVEAAQAAGARRVVVVVGPDDGLSGLLDGGVELAVQQEPLGTADAVAAAAGLIEHDDVVIVLAGDVPLVEAELLRDLGDQHRAADAVATMVTAVLADPAGYGRVVRGAAHEFVRVVETKVAGDASADELAITEVNTGIFAFDGGALLDALEDVGTDNAQGERYLPDVLEILRARDAPIATFVASDPAIASAILNPRTALNDPCVK